MNLKEVVSMVEEDPEGGYAAKALGYLIFTEGDTISQLKENIKNAIKSLIRNQAKQAWHQSL